MLPLPPSIVKRLTLANAVAYLKRLAENLQRRQSFFQKDAANWTNDSTLTHYRGVQSGYEFCLKDLNRLIKALERNDRKALAEVLQMREEDLPQ